MTAHIDGTSCARFGDFVKPRFGPTRVARARVTMKDNAEVHDLLRQVSHLAIGALRCRAQPGKCIVIRQISLAHEDAGRGTDDATRRQRAFEMSHLGGELCLESGRRNWMFEARGLIHERRPVAVDAVRGSIRA